MNMRIKTVTEQERNKIHIDFLRIIAIWLVMFNHTGEKGFFLFATARDSVFFPFYLFISVAVKIAVPLFFMISGALLLGKEESIKTVYKKRIIRYLIVLVMISFIYHLYYLRIYYHNPLGPEELLKAVYVMYSSYEAVGLWYLYSYIAVLVMLPILRRLVKGLRKQEYWYWIICHILLVGCVPILQYLANGLPLIQKFTNGGELSYNSYFSVPLLTATNIFYFVMGYFLEQVVDKGFFSKKNMISGVLLSMAAISICCLMTVYKIRLTGECSESTSQTFHNSLICIPAFTVYMAAKAFFEKHRVKERVKAIITAAGSCSFGIYLLETILRDKTVLLYYKLQPVIKAFPACCVWITVCFLLGFFLIWAIKKIPYIGKWI